MPTPAPPDAFRVWFRLIRLESRIRGAIAERLRGVELSVPQCDVLTTLSEHEGVSQQDLAERLYVTKGNISGLVDRLAAAGLGERRDLPRDPRPHAIPLPPPGPKAFEQQLVRARDLVREAAAARAGSHKGQAKSARKSGKAATSASK